MNFINDIRKYFKKSLSIVFTIILLTGCEQVVTDVKLPYKEQLVIRAILEAGKPVNDIQVQRTLHPLDNYDYDRALVTDAELIISDGTNEYPLNFFNNLYRNDNLIIEAGKQYSLTAKWKGKTATATTIIPQAVETDSIQYEILDYTDSDDPYYYDKYVSVYTYFIPKTGSVYLSRTYDINGYYLWNWDDIIYQFKDRDAKGRIKITFRGIEYFPDMTDKQIRDEINQYNFAVLSYDEPYLNYHNTRNNGSSDGGIFGNNGLNVMWNIKGDGIGLFIGSNRTFVAK